MYVLFSYYRNFIILSSQSLLRSRTPSLSGSGICSPYTGRKVSLVIISYYFFFRIYSSNVFTRGFLRHKFCNSLNVFSLPKIEPDIQHSLDKCNNHFFHRVLLCMLAFYQIIWNLLSINVLSLSRIVKFHRKNSLACYLHFVQVFSTFTL